MKKAILIFVAGLLLSGCESVDYTPPNMYDIAKYKITSNTVERRLAEINSARLILLESGMSKSQVLEIMGTTRSKCHNNPLNISLFNSDEDYITIIYYFTQTDVSNMIICSFQTLQKANYTPLVLLNGKLIGWGDEALRRAKDKYDLTIKQDFDIKVE